MVELVKNYHTIKGPNAKEKEILELLKKPGAEAQIQAIAATLNETFDIQTKLLVDIRPGAVIEDVHDKVNYVYEGAIAPFEFDAMTTVILRQALHPVEDLDDQAYVILFTRGVNLKRNIMAMRDFIKLVAIKRFKVTDYNVSDEKELTKDAF